MKKLLLLLLLLIPNLVMGEEIDFFCEESEIAVIKFPDGNIKKETIKDFEMVKLSLKVNVEKNLIKTKWLTHSKNSFIKKCDDISDVIKNKQDGEAALIQCVNKTKGYSFIFDLNELSFIEINPVFYGGLTNKSYIKMFSGKCYKTN